MKDATRAVISGRDPHAHDGTVNPPVYHASTILFPTLHALRASRHIRPGDGLTYGVHGTSTSFALEEAICALEGGYRTRLCQSGLTACAAPLLCCLGAGDHLLMTDSVYGPTRSFCDGMLHRLGVETSYYDPLAGSDIRELVRPNTRVIYTESPGSWTFEMQDIPAIAGVAHKAGALVMMDNTWASPLYYKPFEHGVDISIQAVTKYIAAHSDLVMGSVTATEAAYDQIQPGWTELGLCAGPDDVFLAMRGLRTLATRLPVHMAQGLEMAEWLAARPEVAQIIHPAREDHPDHALWKRDFLGASSLFAFVLRPEFSSEAQLAALLDHLEHFGMGFSWGGFESLLIPVEPAKIRTASPWPRPGIAAGQLMRIHIGLEAVADLQADLAAGFGRMHRAG